MSNQQVTLFAQEGNAVMSSKFKALAAAGIGNDLGDGIRGSYGIVGIKAGRFRIRYKGQETILTNPDQTPVAFIDVVIVKANAFLNKQYFEGKYVDGSTAPPACYSLDGVKPSDSSPKKQHTTCALCPKNQFGSLVGENGVKQKACRDTKKLAVVPLADIRNETLGGAMLFRVPPGSLKDLSIMADQLKGRGYPYNSVAVRISFDLQASHPKPIFKAIRALDDNEADLVIEMFNSDSVSRVLADNDVAAETEGTSAAEAGAPSPVTPTGAPPPRVRPEPVGPVPQAPAKLVGTLVDAHGQPDPVASVVQMGGVPVKPTAFEPPPVEVIQPRSVRVQPDEPAPAAQPSAPAPAANPFAVAATPAAQPRPAATPGTAPAANPFAPPPPSAAAAAAPVAEPVAADQSQLTADISNILAGLGPTS